MIELLYESLYVCNGYLTTQRSSHLERWKGPETQLERSSHLAITYSKLTIETLEQGVKYVQS